MDNQKSGFWTLNKPINTQFQQKIIIISVSLFITIILISLLITFFIYKYNVKNRNIQTPFFTSPYISLFTELLSVIILLSAGIYLLVFY